MERLDSIDKPNRKPNFTLSQDVDLDKLFRDGGKYRLTEGTDYTGSRSAVESYIRSEWRARYGHCVVKESRLPRRPAERAVGYVPNEKTTSPGAVSIGKAKTAIVVKITPPSLP